MSVTASRTRWAAVLGLVVVLTACGNGDEEEAEQTGGSERTIQVTYVEATEEAVRRTERTLGTITAKTEPRVAAEVAARVEALHADSGQRVEKGELLAELDPEDFEREIEQAEAEINRLNHLIRNQRRTVERNRELVAENFISETALDEAETELEALEEDLASARSRLRGAERNLARTRVEAPLSGEIEARDVSEGDYVQPGTVLFRMAGTEHLRIRLPFPEVMAGQVAVGQEVELTTPLTDGRGVTGRITEIQPLVGQQSQALMAIAEVRNPGGWRPGASVDANLLIEERTGVTVPDQAVVRRPAGRVVYVLEDDDTVAARTVEVGQQTRERTEIVSGLEPGEPVVVDGAGFLTDGARVDASPRED